MEIQGFKFRSDLINELAAALAKAQGEMEIAERNCNNPFFKSRYADYQSIVQASRPALTKNGLSVTQGIITLPDGFNYLLTEMLHVSGQYTSSLIKMNPVKNDIQSISSCNTYIKRMAYANLVGVVTGDEDDDGETVMTEVRKQPAFQPKQTITLEQLQTLEYELKGLPISEQEFIIQKLYVHYDITSLATLPKDVYLSVLQRIKDNKANLAR